MKTVDYPRRYDYQVGGLYLVKKYTVHHIEIMAASDKAFKVRWESGYSSWVLKEDFYFDYSFVEHLNKKV